MTRNDKAQMWRGRRALLLLLALFLLPAAIAWTLFFSGWRPPATSNHGELLDPPVQVEASGLTPIAGPGGVPGFRGQWTMLVALQGPCEQTCQDRLRETRQVRRALAQNIDRAQRVLILEAEDHAPSEAFLERHPDLHVVTGGAEWARGADAPEVALSLIDSRGFRMMEYGEPFSPSGMLDDMKHLLRLSNVDIERLDGLSDRD
ncbi:hypothetical protein [Aquisalimonas asiatica]|uniref:Cytochrome oxidase Cu insertion factor, SCO1/SenC/PrrC family n=1 Tax=Aquisalimonas asiatica TaxID=406100 RepID=A0A1H8TJT8_9GAMM|nr:hypothetical protein [Aquisalimonas asiatica]SEO91340.1 hypothetical protein SAMN04488052_104268 [Aquisalimonas asiatica]